MRKSTIIRTTAMESTSSPSRTSEHISSVLVEDISDKIAHWEGSGRYAIVINNVFSGKECQSLIERSEKNGFENALVNIGGGEQIKMENVRHSNRSIIDDSELAQEIWNRIRLIVKDDDTLLSPNWANAIIGRFQAVGLNERLRFLRYDHGHFFGPHSDGSYIRKDEAGPMRTGERSLVTCQLYLNEGFIGGSTRFLSLDETLNYDVIPKTGSVLLFDHQLNHEGALLIEGRKYVIRTDVMYTNRGAPDYATEPVVINEELSDY